jgi:GH25 family lysozyme M1 (1,4-beta-N-acetylmuramidase)
MPAPRWSKRLASAGGAQPGEITCAVSVVRRRRPDGALSYPGASGRDRGRSASACEDENVLVATGAHEPGGDRPAEVCRRGDDIIGILILPFHLDAIVSYGGLRHRHSGGNTMILGVDTASVAGNKKIDWVAAKAAGLSFAIIRAHWGDQKDTAFDREWPRIAEAGLVRGGYLFLRFPRAGKPAPDPEAQAAAMARSLGDLAPGDLPPTLDVEFPGKGRVDTGLTVAECIDRVMRAHAVLKRAFGASPIVYTSARVWRDDLRNTPVPELLGSPLWLARYYFKSGSAVRTGAAFHAMPTPPVPVPWGGADDWWIHQYQGNAVGFAGFPSGKVDMNRFNPLYRGSGPRVRWVQRRLGLDPTGRFDATTAAAVGDFQRRHGLVADRIVGPRTFARLARVA